MPQPDGYYSCPGCLRSIFVNAKICPFCKTVLVAGPPPMSGVVILGNEITKSEKGFTAASIIVMICGSLQFLLGTGIGLGTHSIGSLVTGVITIAISVAMLLKMQFVRDYMMCFAGFGLCFAVIGLLMARDFYNLVHPAVGIAMFVWHALEAVTYGYLLKNRDDWF